MIYVDTWSTTCRVDIPDDHPEDMIMPGEQTKIVMSIVKSMPMALGQRFTIRENNKDTVATGVITAIRPAIKTHKNSKLKKLEIHGVKPLH